MVIDIMHKTGYRFEIKHVNWKNIRTYEYRDGMLSVFAEIASIATIASFKKMIEIKIYFFHVYCL